jgi:hypothetical protein
MVFTINSLNLQSRFFLLTNKKYQNYKKMNELIYTYYIS